MQADTTPSRLQPAMALLHCDAIALRCGLVSDDSVTLFSGAGLVKGSNPTVEVLKRFAEAMDVDVRELL